MYQAVIGYFSRERDQNSSTIPQTGSVKKGKSIRHSLHRISRYTYSLQMAIDAKKSRQTPERSKNRQRRSDREQSGYISKEYHAHTEIHTYHIYAYIHACMHTCITDVPSIPTIITTNYYDYYCCVSN